MLRPPLLLLALTLCCIARLAVADIIVIVHLDSPLQSMNAQEISDLYLGRQRSTRAGERLLILDQPRDSELRNRFFNRLNGMSLRSVDAYWARLQFSGDSQPPIPLPESAAIVATVRNNRLAVGYIDTASVPDGVRPLLTLREP